MKLATSILVMNVGNQICSNLQVGTISTVYKLKVNGHSTWPVPDFNIATIRHKEVKCSILVTCQMGAVKLFQFAMKHFKFAVKIFKKTLVCCEMTENFL